MVLTGKNGPNERAISKIDWTGFRKRRIAKLISIMKREKIDALLLNRIENVRYATDFRPVVSMWFQNSYSAFVTSKGDVVQLTVAGDYTRAKHYMPWIEDMRIMHSEGRAGELAELFRDYLKGGRIGYDALSFEDHQALQREAGNTELVGLGAGIAEERAVKLEEEVQIMKEASKVTEASIRAALRYARPGMREYELAAEAEYAARRLGAEGMSWSLATFSGLNTGLMLRHDSDKIIGTGEFLILGYATIYRGYNTDITTTTIVGKPSAEQKKLYTATYDSLLAAIKVVRPRVETKAIHDAAENVIREHGYAKYSFSRLQPILHGVGLNVYEPPWSPEPGREGPTMKLRVGHTLAIEPCITLYDKLKVGGCRIGESLVVTENGYKMLTDGKPETHEMLYEN
jgi:Xaa-Pro aminopeptidase